MAVGELVVKLGLDAAEYTSGLTKAELQARRFGEAIGDNIRTGALASSAALLALGGAAIAANAAFNKLLDGAAKFQDLAEETGASAESIAGLSVAAATAGVSVESVAGSMNKLTKNLVGVDDESKAAGAALAALGINVQSFKALDPAGQYDAVSKALAGFADGAGKTAVAMALFGKSGAEQLKVLKALEEQGGATNILTKEQIARADEYRDAQAKLTAELSLYASAIATEFIGPTNELKRVALEAVKELFGLNGEVTSLGRNNGVRDFAEGAAVALVSFTERLGTVIQGMATVGRAAQLMGTNLRIASEAADVVNPLAAAKKAITGEGQFAGIERAYKENQDAFAKLSESYQKTIDKAKGAESKKLQGVFNQRRQDEALNAYYGISGQTPPKKPDVRFGGPTKSGGGGKKDNSAAQEAKAQLSSDLDAIKNAQEAVTNTYANQEKILEALRSAGLKDETAYYQEKQRLLAQTSTAQEDALQKQIARLQQEQLSGKDAIDNAKKIADAEAKLSKVREDSATQAQVLGIQQNAAIKKLADAYADAEAAAQSYLGVISRAAAAEIAGVGKGSKARDFTAGISAIDEKTEAARQALQRDNRNGKFAGRPEDYQRELALLNSSQEAEIAIYRAKYAKLDELQKDWVNGATEALNNYADQSQRIADHMAEAFTNAFKGLEDQLTNFLTGGKFDVKALLKSIQTDLTRNFVKEQITGPLAKMAADSFGSGGMLSGLAGLLGGGKSGAAGALGGASAAATTTATATAMTALSASTTAGSAAIAALTAAATSAATALASVSASSASGGLGGLLGGGGGSSDILGDFISGLSGMASGGNLEPYGMTRVNENGPELLDYRGKQYLMNGGSNATITANHKMGGGGSIAIHQSFAQGTDRKTTDQAAMAAGRAIERARRNS